MVVEGEYFDGPCKLLELPHYVMRILFSYLDATTLYHLSRTCNYLKEFILDPLFWRRIDARDDPNVCDKLEYCTSRIHLRTTHLYLRGNLSFIDLPVNFFNTIQPFENLRVLALENFKLRGSKVTLRDFPPGLQELSLKRTYVKNSDYFFQHSVKNMPKLQVLILDECSWVTCSFLLSVSKYEHLEIISIVKCVRAHLNMIPYLNVAKLGCKKLKIFDCRFTGIGGELLRTFYSKDTLQRLYFQSFKSAEVDYQEKILNVSDSNRKKQPPDPSYTDMGISDIHLCEYFTTTAKPRNEVDKIADSVLYRDPYPECTCGGEGLQEDTSDTNIMFSDEDMVHIPSGRGEPKFVCGKHMKDIVNLPKNFKDFFLSQQQQFHPASDIHLDSDSNSEEEEDDNSCCYFGMGTSLILPSTHDRTPSVGEEMSLPGESASARNQSFPRVYVFNTNRDRDNNQREGRRDSSSPNASRSHVERRNSLENFISGTTKRRHENSDGDSDSEVGQSKKSKKESSAFDSLSNEAQEALVNQLVESVDDVSARIEKIMEANGLTASDLQRTSSRLLEHLPSTSKDKNGTEFSPSCSKSNENQSSSSNNRSDIPSCSRPDTSNVNNGSDSGHNKSASNSSDSNTEDDSKKALLLFNINNSNNNNNNLGRVMQANADGNNGAQERRMEIARYIQVKDPNYWKVKWKIPLKRLSLRGYRKISDFTLSYIKNLDIELIDLTFTSVTKSGIENFLIHNPNCRVIHPLYCTCKPKNPLF